MASMTPPRITTDERGITLNKSLAWTMLVAIISAAFWVGVTVTQLQSDTMNFTETMKEVKQTIDDDRAGATAREARIRALERDSAGQAARFESLSSAMAEVKAELRQTNDMLRQLVRDGR